MPILLRHSPIALYLAVLFIAGGCSTTPPPIEYDLARAAVQDAELAGAEKMAIVLRRFSEFSHNLEFTTQ